MENETEFLMDEVRSGFYIPTAIKQAWATQLNILKEIDRICRKYNIEYFADWGTFLGTVRHGGYIPWDDDMDICMRREDYRHFREVAKYELPETFAVHDYETKENHRLFLARVLNCNRMCFDKAHLDEYYNFPYIATVDIFVLDYLYRDERKERERCEEVKRILAVADGMLDGIINDAAVCENICEFERKYNVTIDGVRAGSDVMTYSGVRDVSGVYAKNGVMASGKIYDKKKAWVSLYRLAEEQMARVHENEADRIGQIFPWILKGGKGFPKEYYAKSVRLPFEGTTMPVSAYFNKALEAHYGGFMKICKIWGGHDYPYFEGQRANLQAVADFKLPEYTFDANLLPANRKKESKAESFKGIVGDCLEQLEDMVKNLGFAATVGNADFAAGKNGENETDFAAGENGESVADEMLQLLPEIQQLAIDLGTYVENVKGEGSRCAASIVTELEKFCECLYALYELLAGETADERNASEEIIDVKNASEEIIDEKNASEGILDEEIIASKNTEKISIDVGLMQIKESFNDVKNVIEREILNKKEILFLVYGEQEKKNWWKGFAKIIRSISLAENDNKDDENGNGCGDKNGNGCGDKNVEIKVIYLPVMRKDAYGQIIKEDIFAAEKIGKFNEENAHKIETEAGIYGDDSCICEVVGWRDYNIALEYPDEVYIQNPYDGENPCLTVPREYYAENVWKYTDKLVYIPPFAVNEFDANASTDIYNMKHYVTAPAVVCADEVRVQSENIKERYVEKLTEFSSKEIKNIWSDKIVVDEDLYCKKRHSLGINKRKKLMFCVGLNEIYENGDAFAVKFKKKLDVIANNADKIDTVICLWPCSKQLWADDREKAALANICSMVDELTKTVRTGNNEDMNQVGHAEHDGNIVQVGYEEHEENVDQVGHAEHDGKEPQIEVIEDVQVGELYDMLEVCDAYYGSATPIAHEFEQCEKPVMIMNLDME